MGTDIRPFVKQYQDAGFDVCPLEPQTKAIHITKWNEPSRTFPLDEFDADSNVGARLGVPGTAPNNGTLIDADLDRKGLPIIIDLFLPPSGATWGRPGKPSSHRAYITEGVIASEVWCGLGGNHPEPTTRKRPRKSCAAKTT